MQYTNLSVNDIDILYVRDIDKPFDHERIDLYIKENLDGTYQILQLPLYHFGYHSDFHNRFAYSFHNLSMENQEMYRQYCRHMTLNQNGSYYENYKVYRKK